MSAFKKLVLAQLECKLCFNYMIPPIRICSKGHSTCDSCVNKFKTCETCKYPFLTTRNYALEEISYEMDIECSKCGNQYPLVKYGSHKENCEGNIFRCTKKILHENYMMKSCKWSGSGEDIIRHFMENHEESCFQMNGRKLFDWVLPYKQDQMDVHLISMEQNHFLHFVYYDFKEGKLCFSLTNIAVIEEKFLYEVHVNNNEKMVYKRRVDEKIKTLNEMLNGDRGIEVILDGFNDYNVNKREISWLLIVNKDDLN